MLKSPLTICKRPIVAFKSHSLLAAYSACIANFSFYCICNGAIDQEQQHCQFMKINLPHFEGLCSSNCLCSWNKFLQCTICLFTIGYVVVFNTFCCDTSTEHWLGAIFTVLRLTASHRAAKPGQCGPCCRTMGLSGEFLIVPDGNIQVLWWPCRVLCEPVLPINVRCWQRRGCLRNRP
jgi:hypothetical protein